MPAQSDPSLERVLLSPGKRIRYALTPKRLYARYRAARDLRRYEGEMHLLRYLVDRRRAAIDGGANRGSYAFFLSRLVPTVYAFEPNPVMRDYLTRAVGHCVKVMPHALSDDTGEATFAVPRSGRIYRNTSGTLETTVYEGASHTFTVPRARIDDLDLGDIGFIKLDVEGHELAAIRGARDTIARCRPTLMVEIMAELAGRSVPDCVAEVCALGYRCLVLDDDRLTCFEIVDPARFDKRDAGSTAPKRINNFLFLPASG